MMEEDARRWRTIVAGVLLGLGFLLALGRLFDLQVLRAEELAQLAGRQHQKILTVEGGRGAISDRNGKILAITMEVPSVFGAPKYVSDPRATAVRLSRVLKADARQLEAKLKSERDFVWLQRRLAPERAEGLQSLSLDGIGVIPEGRRFYPKGVMLSHVLGFGNIDNQGLEGLERRYDAVLRGERGRLVVERDAFGGAVFPKGLNYVAPSPGKDLVLTIDEVIQYIAEQELAEAVTRTRAASGVVIVVEPKTGALLAMAMRPTFDPNEPKGDPNLWRNRAVSDAYEPGSTFKLVAAAAALEEKLVSPDEFIYGENGQYVVENTVVHDHHKNGWMTFAQVLQRSSNIGMVKVVEHLAPEKLAWYINAFGFGQKTDVDLTGEQRGLVKDLHDWSRRTRASIAMGQEIGVTPLQLVMAVSAIANGGWLMRPYVVSEVRSSTGETIAHLEPVVRRRPISAQTAKALTEIMRGAVLPGGTGTLGAVPGYDVAGKTGTAQKIDPLTGGYSAMRMVSSFVGFLPADDPKLAILVVVDEPQTEHWGGTVAAPVFQRIAAQAVRHLGIVPKTEQGQILAAR
ncbi:MAG: penicillin-binding protein 2 [Nitrospirae bacterium]|nr:MAG: penicillin-binding protein 2 [Nitrospirota bacterium]